MKRGKPTLLDYALLGLLRQQPSSGYDLRKIFETTALGNYSSSPGTIYPALRRLERNGWIEGEVERAGSLRPRKVFRPTVAGTETLTSWLARDIVAEDVKRGFDELMLRLAFHSHLGSPAATRRFLESFADEIETYVGQLEEQKRLFPDGAPIHGRLALEMGIESYRAHARWARKATRHFEEKES